MNKKFTFLVYLLWKVIVVSVLFFSCKGPAEKKKSGRLTIVTTTGMIADAVENVAGGKVKVIALMGAGVDPHLYKATHGDLEKLTSADIIFYNGLHLEGKMGDVFEKTGRSKPVIAVASDIPASRLRSIAGFENTHDPHIWFDVKLWENAVHTIRKTLTKLDSSNAAVYEANASKYIAQLDSLDAAVRQRISEIPEAQRVLITAHDAFGYFGAAYDVEVRGLQGISTVSEFGLKDVTELVNFIISRKIKAIFVETSVSQKSIEAVVEGCRDKGWTIKIGGSLYSDAMGKAGTLEGTYIGMVDKNVRTITEALK
jgi:manganese/zinc/iron transport system substrate-binding protein